MKTIIMITFSLISISAFSAEMNSVQGFNLTETGQFIYTANPEGEDKSQAQDVIDSLKGLGVNHIVLNVRAKMESPFSSEIIPLTGTGSVSQEARNMISLIRYIHDQDMTVGIRPIFFVVGADGEFPYIDDDGKIWWHGNIQPADPNRWFESFRNYMDRYISISRLGRVEEFTIGAELYSMTVGLEDQWFEHPFGFPGKWLELLNYTRERLGDEVRIMYDINFTDATENSGTLAKGGGELERWRYRLVDLADPSDPAEYEIWRNLVDFWNGLDAIGIDMYRTLAFESDDVPTDFREASDLLTTRAREYASQLDLVLFEISISTGEETPAILKEVGFRSVENGYIDPFNYATKTGVYNELHQAIGYDALFRGFWEPEFEWFAGFVFWDTPIHPRLHGPQDLGFSPIGKPTTEEVIREYFVE